MNVYVITNPSELNGASECAGRLLHITKDNDNRLVFRDVATSKKLATSPPVTKQYHKPPYLFFHTRFGSIYKLMEIINFQGKEATVTEESKPMEVEPLQWDEKNEYKDIHYGDGYRRSIYTFNRELTEEEFIGFLKSRGIKIRPKKEWYNDYSKIEGNGNTWTYTWVMVYTD